MTNTEAADVEPVAWQNLSAPYSILTPEQYGMRMPLAEGRFRPLYASPSTEVERLTSELADQVNIAIRTEARRCDAVSRAENAEATIRSLEERLTEAERRWMMSDAQFADMEFLSIEGFLDWQKDRRLLTKLKEGQPNG